MSVMSKSMMQSAAAQRRCVVTRMVPFRGERTTICSDLGSKFSTSSRQILCSSDEDCGLGHVRERGVTGPFTSCDAGFAHTTFHWPNLFLHQQPATEIFLSFATEPRKIFSERFLPSSHCFFFSTQFSLSRHNQPSIPPRTGFRSWSRFRFGFGSLDGWCHFLGLRRHYLHTKLCSAVAAANQCLFFPRLICAHYEVTATTTVQLVGAAK